MNSTHFRTSARRASSLTCMALAASVLCACTAPNMSRQADADYKVARDSARAMQEHPPLAEQGGDNVRGGSKSADRKSGLQHNPAVARRATMPYLGSKMVPATAEDRLPAVFQEPYTLDFTDLRDPSVTGGGVSLSIVMARLSKLTNMPIRVQQDVYNEKADTGGAAPAPGATAPGTGAMPGMPLPMPSPALVNGIAPPAETYIPPVMASNGRVKPAPARAPYVEPVSTTTPITVRSVEMKYSGTIANYLNMITDRLGLAWEYRDSTIVISRFVIESHEVYADAGSQKYSMGGSSSQGTTTGGSGTQGTSTSTSDVSQTGTSDTMASMIKTITAMMSEVPGSTVNPSDGSGHLIVKTSREMQSRVREYIKAENNSMRRQASIQFDIYSVTVNDSDQHGVDWNAAFKSLRFPSVQLGVASPTTLTDATVGTVGLTVLPNLGGVLSQTLGNSSAIIQALTENGYSAQHRPVSMVAMNRHWTVQSKTGTEYYLSETTPGPASSTGVGAPGLKTDKITTGDRYVVKPTIYNDNTIVLNFDLSLSDLLGLFDVTVGTGLTAQKVQAPKTSAVGSRQEISLRPGEVVAITGLSRDVATTDARRLGEGIPLGLGGSKTVSTTKEYFLIFVRASVL